MSRLITGVPFLNSLLIVWILFLALIMTGCSTSLAMHSDFVVPDDSLRLAQVMEIEKRAVVVQSKKVYEAIIASGVGDSNITDGSIVVARIYCCGGSAEKANAIILYVPNGINVALGDIVEVRVGHPPEKGDVGSLNTITRVVQKNGDDGGNCWWDPKDDRLWLRVLYCDWMAKEGWIKQGGISPAWYRPSNAILPDK